MKKLRWSLGFLLTILICCGVAAAVENDTVKVGLRYGSSAMFSANLENAVGSGYAFGYYERPMAAMKRPPPRRRVIPAAMWPISPIPTACVLAAMRRRTRPFWPSPAPDWTAEPWRPAAPAWW